MGWSTCQVNLVHLPFKSHSSSPSQAGSSPSVTSWHPSVFLKGGTPSVQSPWPTNNPPQPVAGVKRKTPPVSASLGPQPPQPPQPQQSQQPPQPQQPQSSSQSQPQQLQRYPSTFPYPIDPNATLESIDPGPVNWPNSVGSRPTLTGGLGGASILLCTLAFRIFSLLFLAHLRYIIFSHRLTT